MDEATDQSMNMYQNTVMTALIPDMTPGETLGNIEITPVTSMAQEWAQNMTGGMTQANSTSANSAMGQFFNIGDILTTHPMDPLAQGSGAGANQDQRNYGMTLAAMSQEAYELAMPYSSGIVTSMMDDASDGIMDGMMGSNQISMGGMGGMMGGIMMQSTAGTSDLANAMTTFVNNTTYNRSGLTTADMQTLINKLNASNGNLHGGAATTGTINGTAAKGPVNGGTVTAYGINSNGTRGTQIGTASTDAQGNFAMQVGDYSGAVMLQLSGGHYMDEATDQTMNMDQNTVMTAVIPDMSAGETIGNIEITPLTSMAQARALNMAGGMTQANIALANSAMGQYFDISDILTTHPMDPLVQDSGAGTNQDQRNYGMTLASMSQEAYELAMPNSSGIVTAMMDDASDGRMDGIMGGSNISMGGMGGMMGGIMMQSTAGTSDLANAMTTFVNNTTYNRSGLTTADMQTLIDKLIASTGTI